MNEQSEAVIRAIIDFVPPPAKVQSTRWQFFSL